MDAIAIGLGIFNALLLVLILIHMLRQRAARSDAPDAIVEEMLRAQSEQMMRRLEAFERRVREDLQTGLSANARMLTAQLGESGRTQGQQLEAYARQIGELSRGNDERMERIRASVEGRLGELRADNAQQLERMRQTVDEKLTGTLERRLGASFQLVSERLEQVYKGLGEMQALASGVGDLKRVLTNVTARGLWGEMQLGALLESMLAPSQYVVNAAIGEGARERVEFAVRLPGLDESQPVLLPIDSKFPQEDYLRLLDAQQAADVARIEAEAKRLETSVRTEAKRITKYIQPPLTTDFAILFLPVEGLYAEVVRRTGLVESLQREQRVVIAGPTTLAALLNSLSMGFRTLAIQKRSADVWELLGAIKNQFGKFTELLEKTQKKLHGASADLESATSRSRQIVRKLDGVQAVERDERLLLDEDMWSSGEA